MTSRIINIHIKENIGSTEMYLNNELYTSQKNETDCFIFLLKDYFKPLLIQLNLNKKQLKLEFFNENYKYYKLYADGLDLYIPTDVSYQQIQEIFKAIGYNLKVIVSKNYILECKRNLIEVESFYPPALFFNNITEEYYLCAGSDLNLNVGKKEISLFFDVLYIKKELEKTEIQNLDEDEFQQSNNSWESYLYLVDENENSEYKKTDDKQEKLF